MSEYFTFSNGDYAEIAPMEGMEGKYILSINSKPHCWGTYAECICVKNLIQERIEGIR